MTHPTRLSKISIEQWTLGFCMVNVLLSVVHQTNILTLVLLGASAVWILSGRRISTARSILGIAVGLAAGLLGLWRQTGGWSIALAIVDALLAVVLLQCHFSQFSLRESVIFLVKQSVRFETIYVILFGLTLAILPQLYKFKPSTQAGDFSMTGLNTQVGPGGVAKIAQSSRVAFMVQFEEDVLIKPEDLYWAAARLDQADDMTWKQSNSIPVDVVNTNSSDVVHQSIFAHLDGSNIAVALDGVSSIRSQTKGAVIERNGTGNYIIKGAPRSGAVRYDAWSSMTHESTGSLTESDRATFTKLREPPTDRVMNLAKSLDLRPGDAMVAAISIQSFFHDNAFSYSLSPTKKARTADEFLFWTKSGFCEHYAASFAVMMRALNYPTRLVVGYQGGSQSKVSSKMIVRDQDAHVWTEVWSIKKSRWVRFDPTFAVAPERIHLGSDSLSELSSRPFYLQWLPMISLAYSELAPDLLAFADVYDNQWLNTIVDKIVAFAADNLWPIAIVVVLFLSYILTQFLLWVAKRLEPDPVMVIFRRFRRRLKKKGMTFETSDTATSICYRAEAFVPQELQPQLRLFAEEFNRLKYSGKEPRVDDVRELRRLSNSIFK